MNLHCEPIAPLTIPKQTPRTFQIKRFDDPTFAIVITVKEEEDPEAYALEQLGFFVIPEVNCI